MREYSVAVIGAGHAGVEAALAAARLGEKTALFTINLDAIANMPCNPSIGGTAKGHLVREIDALGGEMAKVADKTFLQSRMLNRGKGPAVHSLRVQSDRMKYHAVMKSVVEKEPNIDVIQSEITRLICENGQVKAVVTALGERYEAKTVIIASGTYLKATIHVGEASYASGPDGHLAANALSESLKEAGITLRRFKTGTPARVHRRSIDFSRLEVQEGDEPIVPMSFETRGELKNTAVCHIAYTNEKTHEIIRGALHRSPLYAGRIEGVGPRYCPSIEDKVVRFSEKPRHQLFIEPMGEDTEEMYLQGMSSSLPVEVQEQMYRSVEGLENVEIMRNAYAIEYDCCDPTELFPSLEFKAIGGLYGAGQFNGTSGYEEAAAQGLVAGINAARRVQGKEPVIFPRSQSYIGTLIDDIVTKGCTDPYRMMTSRSEYRLFLRQDNADLRLLPVGYEIGLISEERYQRFLTKKEQISAEINRLNSTGVAPSDELNALLVSRETSPIANGATLADLIRRPQISYSDLAPFDKARRELSDEVCEQAEIEIKYEGYIKKQTAQVEELRRLEKRRLSPDTDYREVVGLRLEAAEKLNKIKPLSIGQAAGISGVNPADIAVLIIRGENGEGDKK
ncbi:MAG: tRNA uridine-5-carboxymethylaminomethyl(34) synthesis enzyme MnmG [Oscillospiraceae bacterium]|nr:tRNA uridine-5-carboxymethylaminomethyl(34) synthesis enzyme MnmG [Oscillospiraceae bacterium]